MACYDLPDAYGPGAHGQNTVWSSTVCSGCCVQAHHGAICLSDMVHGNKLLTLPDANNLIDCSATALDGSNIRALRCAAGVQKNIPMSPEIMGWVAFAMVLALNSIWRQTEAVCR
jgi:hypothetical protein